MEKLEMESMDITERNVEKLLELFPEVSTEEKDEKGNIKRKIDFEHLKEVLGSSLSDEKQMYSFTWPGKREADAEVGKKIRKTLRPDIETSVDWDKTKNIYIEGDNLEALKLLQKGYTGKIKMIYIDPPYNTGNDFIYKDNFTESQASYEEKTGVKDNEGNRLVLNNESNGRFHSDWCSMIYPRLKLARDLLTDDGVIFISIDDNEQANLKKICDEIFGEDNFVACFTWIKKKKGSNLSKTVRNMTEYMLCYSKCYKRVELYGEKAYSDKLQPLANRVNAYKTLKFPSCIVETTLSNGTYKKGSYNESSNALEFKNDFIVQNGIITNDFSVSGPFKWTQDKLNSELSLGTEIFLSSKFGINVLRADQENKIKRPTTILDSKSEIGTNEDAYSELRDLFKCEAIMSYPKPLSLLKYLVRSVSYLNNDAIVLDFFSGSATTAHAVMQLNAEDDGKRKFILVQLPEITYKGKTESYKDQNDKEQKRYVIDPKTKYPVVEQESEALKAGYKTICDIGKERIRRAGKKIKEENKEKDIDIGFRVFKIDESNMKDSYYIPEKYKQEELKELENNIKEGRTDEDLLFGVMLDYEMEVSLPYETQTICGQKVFLVNGKELVACFGNNIEEEVFKQIAEKKPGKVVFKDGSFKDDAAKMNTEGIFKRISPNTDIRII